MSLVAALVPHLSASSLAIGFAVALVSSLVAVEEREVRRHTGAPDDEPTSV